MIKGGNFVILGIGAGHLDLDGVVAIEVDSRVAPTLKEEILVRFLSPFGNVGHWSRLAVIAFMEERN